MQDNDFNLIGGITIDQIIDCVPIFDAMTPKFWSYANDYIPKDILCDANYNQALFRSISRNIWFKNRSSFCFDNNGLTISIDIQNASIKNITISQSSNILFSIKYENI